MQIDKGPFVIFDNKTVATNLQQFVVLWLIATYGLSYPKSIEIFRLKEMLIAIIDENHMLGQDPSCAAQSKLYSVAFMDLTKKVKAAAGISILLLCTSMTPDDFRAELRALISHYDGILKVPGAAGRPVAQIIKHRFLGKPAVDPPAVDAPAPAATHAPAPAAAAPPPAEGAGGAGVRSRHVIPAPVPPAPDEAAAAAAAVRASPAAGGVKGTTRHRGVGRKGTTKG